MQSCKALRSFFMCLFFLFSLPRISAASALGTITPSQYIRDGETLVSVGGSYELGFFSPGKSKSRYLGIWYNFSTDAVVWVANRETPLGDSSGLLKLTEQGVLVLLLNSSNSIVWSSNSSRIAGNPVSQLLDSGNLVVQDENETNPDDFLWQSFDYPCHTHLPKMKIGWDLVTGLDRYLSSWKSTEDPAPGEFSVRIDYRGLPQLLLMKGAKILARPGSWNGLYLTGIGYGSREPNPISAYEFVLNKDEVYYEYSLRSMSAFSRIVLNPLGVAEQFTWVYQKQSWELPATFLADRCESYALCGPFSSCSINNFNTPICACLKGFVPKSSKDWNLGYWSDGCVRRTPLACSDGDGFIKYSGMKLPDTSTSWFDKSTSLKECKGLCLGNCSCTACANLDITEGGSGCVLWFHNLVDIKEFPPGGGQDLYIRVAASERGTSSTFIQCTRLPLYAGSGRGECRLALPPFMKRLLPSLEPETYRSWTKALAIAPSINTHAVCKFISKFYNCHLFQNNYLLVLSILFLSHNPCHCLFVPQEANGPIAPSNDPNFTSTLRGPTCLKVTKTFPCSALIT